MSLSVKVERPDRLPEYWADESAGLAWDCLFTLPPWIAAWEGAFRKDEELKVIAVMEGNHVAGIAPLVIAGHAARIVGSADVCDYLDLIVVPGKEDDFAEAFMDYLRAERIRFLECGFTRGGSAIGRVLSYWKEKGVNVSDAETEESYRLELPGSREDYMSGLSSRERHELRRKTRRLEESGKIDFVCIGEPERINGAMDIFIELFRKNRDDKAAFMTRDMESFFRDLALGMAVYDMTRIYMLEIDGVPAASNLCFEYGGTLYLYNNGYDREMSGPGAAYLCKAMSVMDAIDRGLMRFDFLKGAEPYKRRLGGRAERLVRRYVKLN